MKSKTQKRKGKLIILEGGDGSGKGTQTKLLIEELRVMKTQVTEFDFPRYEGSVFGKLVGEALKGLHGDFRNMSPYLSSLPYALDRMTAGPHIEGALGKGHVVSNRYTTSNIAYQSAKLSGKKKHEYIAFMELVEYGELRVPEPDIVIYLHVPVKIAHALVAQKDARGYMAGKKGARDQHERDMKYLEQAVKAYLSLAKNRPNWHVIKCVEKGRILERDVIHKKILEVVLNAIGSTRKQ